jgi:hypothetical protein
MKEFIQLIIGNQGLAQVLAFTFFTIFGMLIVKIVRYDLKKKKMALKQVPFRVKFDFKIWLNDNLIDFILAYMVSFSLFRFFPDALSFLNRFFPDTVPNFSDKMFYGLLLGVLFQYLLHKLMNNVYIDESTFNKQLIAGELPKTDDE